MQQQLGHQYTKTSENIRAEPEQHAWRDLLKTDLLWIGFSYVHKKADDHTNEFHYVNESGGRERVTFILLDKNGGSVSGYVPRQQVVEPGHAITADITTELNRLGARCFEGSIMFIVHHLDKDKPFIYNNKDIASVWRSEYASITIGTAGFAKLNHKAELHKKSYIMFCPSVVNTKDKQTRIVLFNNSTDSDYSEIIHLPSRLHNLDGETIHGADITIMPFGTAVLDVAEIFGKAGYDLLAKTGGRGSVTVSHQGHTIVSFFFDNDKKSDALIAGRHTQPLVLSMFKIPSFNYWANAIGKKIPFAGHIVPIVSYIKHHPKFYRIFYPHRSNIVGTFGAWFKQSRFVVWSKMMVRAFFLLARRGFKIDQIKLDRQTYHNKHVVEHNLWNELKLFQFSRDRIERLIYPLNSILSVNKNGKTLCIGPKNEGEILLFESHGFKDVVGIDLFTYSPKILLMDMHSMDFSDDTFDTIFCGACLAYAYDVRKVVEEITRVAKDGAIVVVSFGLFKPEDKLEFILDQLNGGIDQLLGYFGDKVGHVFWRNEELVPGKTSRNCSVIFQLKKNG